MINYNHPFVTFQASVSEGTYIRSLGEAIGQKLKTTGILSMLERVHEGIFYFEDEKALKPIDIVDAKDNIYHGSDEDIDFGRKIALEQLDKQDMGKYIIQTKDNFAIIAITNEKKVDYILNRVPKC